ncbi:ArnT family glycosyltransferase [Brachybacterium paraconglomeratum]
MAETDPDTDVGTEPATDEAPNDETLTAEVSDGAAAAGPAPVSRRTALLRGPDALWRWGAAASVLLVVVLHAVVARGARTPSFPFDEVVLLQYSKFLAGSGVTTPPRGAGYFPAWSVVMAPIWWFTENPAVAYRAAIALGVVVAVATIWPLARAVTRLGPTMPQAVVVASLVMAMPARAVQSGYVTSEKLLFLALACTMLAALRLWEKPTVPRALVFGLAAAVLTTTHARAVVLLIACAVWLLLLAIRSWRAALAGLAVALPLGYLAFWSGGRLNQYLGGGFSQGEKVLGNLLESRPSIILRAIVGQAWEQTAGSLGLVAVGLVVLLVLVWRELRHGRSIGPACLLAAMLLGLAVLSVGQWASESRLYLASWRRLDAWLYGRYLDPATGLLVAVGAAAMIRGASRRVLAPALGLAAALIGVTVLWLAPDAPTWGYVTPAHIPGVMPFFWALPEATTETWAWGLVPSLTNENRFWLLASIPPLLLLVALLVIGRRGRRATAILTAVVLAVTAAGTLNATRATDHFQRLEGGRPAVADEINRLQEEHDGQITVEFDRSCTPGLSNNAVVQNKLAYWIHPTTMGVTKDRNTSTAQIILGCDIWPEGNDAGARMISDLHSYGYHVWVMPGPLQDELADKGVLDPVAVPVGP